MRLKCAVAPSCNNLLFKLFLGVYFRVNTGRVFWINFLKIAAVRRVGKNLWMYQRVTSNSSPPFILKLMLASALNCRMINICPYTYISCGHLLFHLLPNVSSTLNKTEKKTIDWLSVLKIIGLLNSRRKILHTLKMTRSWTWISLHAVLRNVTFARATCRFPMSWPSLTDYTIYYSW